MYCANSCVSISIRTLVEIQCDVRVIRSKQIYNSSCGKFHCLWEIMTHFDTRQIVNYIEAVPNGKEAGPKISQAASWNWPACETCVEKKESLIQTAGCSRVRSGELGDSCQRFKTLLQKQERTFGEHWFNQCSLWPQSDSQNPTWGVEKRAAKRQERELGNPLMSLQCGHEWLDFRSVRLFDDSGYKGLVLIKP